MVFYRSFGKRALDIILAAVALAALSPVLAAVAAAIKVEDCGPVLFRQERVGRNGRRFTFLKFRSMPVDSETVESAAADTLQITRVGALIRRSSVDELPQLVNIVRGDMSIVGPRPPIPTQIDLIHLRRANGAISLRPGLTGLAQINSYDGMSADEKAHWDGVYAKSVSFASDLAIIVKTVAYLAKPPPTY